MHLFAQRLNLFPQTFGLRFYLSRLRAICCLQRIQIALNTLFDLRLPFLNLIGREVLVPLLTALNLLLSMATVACVNSLRSRQIMTNRRHTCHDIDDRALALALERIEVRAFGCLLEELAQRAAVCVERLSGAGGTAIVG